MTESEDVENKKRKKKNPDIGGTVECVGTFIGDIAIEGVGTFIGDIADAVSSLIPDL